MKAFFHTLVLAALISVVCNQPVSGQRPDDFLTNSAVVKLTKARFKEKTVISLIFARAPKFDLSADRLIELKRDGVSEKVIVAMLARQQGATSFDEDEWGEASSLGAGSAQIPGDGTGIFGSSNGQKSRSNNGSTSGDTMTSGSATVRILKPAAEAGEPTKLEKTKSLTNDSIVELVEAGFSEGTIIRRIEQSPVEFDLAAPKIEELRKRRVSDKILSAMKTAMGDESSK
jgi:hypothetical protein